MLASSTLIALTLISQPAPPDAPVPDAHRHALLIGNNLGSEDQSPLRFAESDARAFGEVLETLGHYDKGSIQFLASPNRSEMLAALSELEKSVSTETARGEQSIVTFYYSGHADESGLNLGTETLALEELRIRLDAVPATVKVVVLDACRSGAFSRTKGVTPAEDFSVNSVRQLETSGMAVLASSSSRELSQETDALGGSFFTHHFLNALRGAADRDEDGRVSLQEAHHYAYHQTLFSTAQTKVGRQHVTFEQNLEGRGDLTLTTPGDMRSVIEIPEDLAADVVVTSQRGPDPVVFAEIHKTAGASVRIAAPPGRYVAFIRRTDILERCEVEVPTAGVANLRPGPCPEVSSMQASTKGASATVELEPEARRFSWRRGWGLEVAVGVRTSRDGGLTDRLSDFGYAERSDLFDAEPIIDVTFTKELFRYLDLGVAYTNLDSRDFAFSEADQFFGWRAHAMSVLGRGKLPLFRDHFVPYVQANLGLGWAKAAFNNDESTDFGYVINGAIGLQLMPFDHFGGFFEGSLSYAPIVENLLGDQHDHGGTSFVLGLRGQL